MTRPLGMTVDEVVAYLSRTELPTLIVEGSGDKAVLRRVQSELADLDIDFLPSEGKENLDQIYNRRAAFTNRPVSFLRDKDTWVIFGVPSGREEMIFTTGYSIENDIIDKATIEGLAHPNQALLHQSVEAIAHWFCRAIYLDYRGEPVELGRDVSEVWADGGYSAIALSEIERANLDDQYLENFPEDAWVWLRGKTLLRCIHRHLSSGSPRYTKDHIVDLCIRLGRSPALVALLDKIRLRFQEIRRQVERVEVTTEGH